MKKLVSIVMALMVVLSAMAVRVHTLGDSLSEGKAADSEQQGWPSFLSAFLNGMEVVNPAKSGTSTKSFYKGYWSAAKANVQAGDYVIVQFSHNDENNDGVDADEYNLYLTQEGQATSTDVRGTSPETMREYLRKYIAEIRALGATPILSSAICRFWFKGDTIQRSGRHDLGGSYSTLVNNNGTWVYTTGLSVPETDHSMDLSYIIKQVAQDSGVYFIDMTEASRVLDNKYGETQAKALMGVSTDGTHTNATGAYMMAREVAKLLKSNVPYFADKVTIPTAASLNPTSFSLGELYTGVAKVSQTLLTGDGLSPESGTATITAGNNLEVSLDGENYAKTQTASYTSGTLFQKIYVKATYTAAGTDVTDSVKIQVGGQTLYATVKASPVSLAGGADVSVGWQLRNKADVTSVIGLTAGAPTCSNMQLLRYRVLGTNVDTMAQFINTGMSANGAWDATIDVVENRYIDFAVTAPSTMDVKISGISMVIGAAATGNLRCRMRLGDGTTFGDAIYDNTSGLTSNTEVPLNLTPVYTIKAGKTMHLRIWPWSNAAVAQKYFCMRDVVISGKAFEAGEEEDEPDPVVGAEYTFGIGRDLNAAKDSLESDETVKGTYPEQIQNVTIAPASEISFVSRAGKGDKIYTLVDGTATQVTASKLANNRYKSTSTAAGTLADDFYFGYTFDIADGYQLEVSALNAELAPATSRASSIKPMVYSIKGATENLVYEGTAVSANAGSVPTVSLDASTIAALQKLAGKIAVRLEWIQGGSSSYCALRNLSLTGKIAVAAADTLSPLFTTQPEASSEVMVNNAVNLTVAAQHYSQLTWYLLRQGSGTIEPDPATDTELGKGDKYTFTSATPGTYYIYCRAYNEDATGEQYANSEMAVITVKNIVYPLTLVWDFTSTTDQDYFTQQFAYQKKTGTVHSNVAGFDLYVDATSGKFSTQGRTNLVQINQGTKLQVPVGSTNDVVKVTVNNGAQVTVGGELVTTSNEFTHQVYKAEADSGYVEIVSIASGYMARIEAVLQGDSAKEDRQATVTYYDVDGTTVLGSVTKTVGETIGTATFTPTIPDGYTNHGWVNEVAGAVAETQVVVADMAVYPYITKVENERYMIPAGNGRQLYNTVKNADLNSTLYLPNGTYDLGTACRTELRKGFTLLGESREGVMVVNHPTAPGIQATSTFRITGDSVYLQHLTLRSDVSYSTSATHGVGVALEVNGDKSVCYDVDLQCNQDTYYSNGSADQRGYMKNCRIEGTVDYICGGGNIWFENTTLYCNQRYDGNSQSYTQAGDVISAPSTAAATQYGYVMSNCTIDGADCQAGNYNLARPWQNSPAITWLNTTCVKIPGANGYGTMSADKVLRFHEYNTHKADGTAITGHTLDNCSAAAGSDAIYLTSVGNYTYQNVVMASDGWDPEGLITAHNQDKPSGLGETVVTPGVQKIIRNGEVLILKNGQVYDAMGRMRK